MYGFCEELEPGIYCEIVERALLGKLERGVKAEALQVNMLVPSPGNAVQITIASEIIIETAFFSVVLTDAFPQTW